MNPGAAIRRRVGAVPAAIGFENAISPSQVASVLATAGNFERATTDRANRRGQVMWYRDWIGLAWHIVKPINDYFFGFDIDGVEPPQLALYREGDFFDWHMDRGGGDRCRKLSLTIQLTDPSEYDGGDLELRTGADVVTAKRTVAHCEAFPAWILHRVTPVTRGVRRSLVVWAYGPEFR